MFEFVLTWKALAIASAIYGTATTLFLLAIDWPTLREERRLINAIMWTMFIGPVTGILTPIVSVLAIPLVVLNVWRTRVERLPRVPVVGTPFPGR